MSLFQENFHWRAIGKNWPWPALIGLASILRASGHWGFAVACVVLAGALVVLKSVERAVDGKTHTLRHRIGFAALTSFLAIGATGFVVFLIIPRVSSTEQPAEELTAVVPKSPEPAPPSPAAAPPNSTIQPDKEETRKPSPLPDKAAHQQSKQNEASVFIDCRMGLMPKTVPPSGRIYVLITGEVRAANGGGGLTEYFTEKGEFNWGKPDAPPQWAYRCDITNYADKALINLEMSVPLTFSKVVPVPGQPNSLGHGEVTLNRDWPVNIAKVDAGPANPWSFYIWNCCLAERFVDVKLPQYITAQLQGGDGTRHRIKVEQTKGMLSQSLMPPIERKE